MGWESEAVSAAIIVVKGTKGGVFVYNGSGQLTESMAQQANVDPLTHSNLAGIVSYDPVTTDYSQMLAGALFLKVASGPTGVAGEIGTQGIPGFMVISSPETGLGDAASVIELWSKHGSAEGVAQAVIGSGSFTPGTKALLEVQGSEAVIPGTITSAVTGTPGLVVGGPKAQGDSILAISDDPANPRTLGASMIEVIDQFNAPIFDVPPAGGPKTFGDFMGVWLGVFSGAVCQMLPWGGMQPSGFTTIGGSAPSNGGAAIYAGPGAPPNATIVSQMNTYMTASGAQAFHQQGDAYFRTDGAAGSWLYRCSVSGTALAPGGTWVNMV